MIQMDLEKAGIPYLIGENQYFDFHALRGQFCTMLAKKGVPMATVQKLERHSDIRITARYYTHIEVSDMAEALESLPGIPEIHSSEPQMEVMLASITDDVCGAVSKW